VHEACRVLVSDFPFDRPLPEFRKVRVRSALQLQTNSLDLRAKVRSDRPPSPLCSHHTPPFDHGYLDEFLWP
jgi:hypothetical protein